MVVIVFLVIPGVRTVDQRRVCLNAPFGEEVLPSTAVLQVPSSLRCKVVGPVLCFLLESAIPGKSGDVHLYASAVVDVEGVLLIK